MTGIGRKLAVLSVLVVAVALAAGCALGERAPVSATAETHSPRVAARPRPLQQRDWLAVKSWLYQLQNEDVERIGESAFDLVVVSLDAADGSPAAFPALKNSPGGPKIVLCYMSIGQAESYRSYWQSAWAEAPPPWLDEPDPDWQGDYWVRYWDPGWQRMMYGQRDSYLDRLMALNCDGVYLDRVDAYVYYAEQGRAGAAQEMVDFVLALAAYARERDPGFGIFVQNAEELGLQFPQYLAAATGIGVEDLYYGNPRAGMASPAKWTAQREEMLRQWRQAGKLVLTVDYTDSRGQVADAYRRARQNGFVPYAGDRSLARLRINPGFEPGPTAGQRRRGDD